jgi:hypothetical protein
MVNVELIPIDVRVPSDWVRVVAHQPFIRLKDPAREPFQWSDDAVDAQLAAIQRTLDVAQESAHTRFVLFPEYSVPGVEGAVTIDGRIKSEDWPHESVVIAGLDGIDKGGYGSLCNRLNAVVSNENAPDIVPNNQWVNCSLTWAKQTDGKVRVWAQPKIRPSWAEANVPCRDMFCGGTLYVFECTYAATDYPCRFVTLVCFDWVAEVSGRTVCDDLLEQLNTRWKGTPSPLHWAFVIQHNEKPNHTAFLNQTSRFLTDVHQYPFVERRQAVVIHANTAASARPSRRGPRAFSACVFSPSAQLDCSGCRPTACMDPRALRGSDTLARCKDVVFREMGECIHAFSVRVPQFVGGSAADRTLPLEDAVVHGVIKVADPRLQGIAVPADSKWLNDSLDSVALVSTGALEGLPLEALAAGVEPAVIAGLRTAVGRTPSELMEWADCSMSRDRDAGNEDRSGNADLWGESEAGTLEHVVHALTSLGIAYELDVVNSTLHGRIGGDAGRIEVVAIRADSYEECRAHYDRAVPKAVNDPVLVVARDRDNLVPMARELQRIDEDSGPDG